MLHYDFQSDVGYWVHMTAHRFECAMNSELAEAGITYRQCQVLAWLALEGQLSQANLARLMHVEPPTIVKVIDRMERDGLIVRQPCPDDRRIRMIVPTRKAVPVWKRIVKCGEQVKARSLAGLTDAEGDTLRKLLQRLHDNLESTQVDCPVAQRPPPVKRKRRAASS